MNGDATASVRDGRSSARELRVTILRGTRVGRRRSAVIVLVAVAMLAALSAMASPATARQSTSKETAPLNCSGVGDAIDGRLSVDAGGFHDGAVYGSAVVPPYATVKFDVTGDYNLVGLTLWQGNSLYANAYDAFTGEFIHEVGRWHPKGTESSGSWSSDYSDTSDFPGGWENGSTMRVIVVKLFGELASSGSNVMGDFFSWHATWSIIVPTEPDPTHALCPLWAIAFVNALLGARESTGMASDPVSTATGNLYEHREDLGSGFYGLSWSRSYNSLDGLTDNFDYSSQPRVMGAKWVTPVDVHLKPLDTTTSGASAPGQTSGLEYMAADGRRVVIPAAHSVSGDVTTFTGVPGDLYAAVTFTNHIFTMTFTNGEVYTFDDLGRLSTKTDGAGQMRCV